MEENLLNTGRSNFFFKLLCLFPTKNMILNQQETPERQKLAGIHYLFCFYKKGLRYLTKQAHKKLAVQPSCIFFK